MSFWLVLRPFDRCRGCPRGRWRPTASAARTARRQAQASIHGWHLYIYRLFARTQGPEIPTFCTSSLHFTSPHFTSHFFTSLHFTSSLLNTTLITRSYLLRFLLFLITFIYLFGYLLANFVAFSCMPPILKIIENTLRSYIDFRSLLHYFPYTILSLPARLSFFNQSFYSS